MNVWLRRLIYLVIILVWLAIMMLPATAFILARNGQIQVGEPDGPHTRLFLLQDADAEGLGLERARTVRPPASGPDTVTCLRTTVSYWMWAGEAGQNTSYCQCIDQATGGLAGLESPSCMVPSGG